MLNGVRKPSAKSDHRIVELRKGLVSLNVNEVEKKGNLIIYFIFLHFVVFFPIVSFPSPIVLPDLLNCLYVCLCTMYTPGARGDQKRTWDSLEPYH